MYILDMIKQKINVSSKSMVGLDLGSSQVKVVQVGYNQGLLQLEKFAYQRIESKTKEAVSEAIKRVFSKAGIKNKNARVALGGEAIIVRYIQMPKMSEADLNKAIDFEAEKYIPFKKSEICLDFQIIEKEHHFDKSKMHVLLVVAKKDFINQQIEIVQQAGINLSLIDVDTFSLINAFLVYGENQPDKTIVLLNMGAKHTNIDIVKNNLPFFTRDISLGGDNLTQVIKDKMKVSVQEAEKIKFNQGDLEGDEEPAVFLKPVLDNLLVEVKLSFDYFENQIERGLDMVYLTGGSSVIKGIDKYFSDKLGLPVKCWNPVQSINISADISVQELKSMGASLGVCLGLTLREI